MGVKQFDYGIIGAGAAGLQLALALTNDDFFKDKSIIILDKAPKNKNDKTWCFWEKGNGRWDEIVSYKWQKCVFADKEGTIELSLNPFAYKKIRSIDFYDYSIAHLTKKNNVSFVYDTINNVEEEGNNINIFSNKNEYQVKHCFDSRIDTAFYNENLHPYLQQHFEGWLVEFEEPVLDESQFTIMDYRASYNTTTSFMYVLPLNKQQAIIEFTGFTKTVFEKEVYKNSIDSYINKYITDGGYQILEKEGGIIPMSTFPFEKANTNKLTKIGTAGGWVRASSGYSFKNCERYVAKIIKNLKKDEKPSNNFVNKKHRLFDAVLLQVLSTDNSFGLKVFSDLYRKNKLPELLEFLDGTTNFAEDLRIMNSVDKVAFIKALLQVKSKNQN